MKSKDFEIYKEGHLEGYKIGLRDMANYERRFKLEEYKNRTIFLLVSITGIGNILYFIFYHHHNVYVRLIFHLISFLLFFVYLYFLGKDYILDKKNKLIKRLKKIKEIKTETKPINIKFKTKDGKNVSFKAVKVVKKKNKNAPTLKNENQKLFKLRNH